MSFMQPQVYFGGYFKVADTIVPSDVIGRTCATAAEAFANYVEGNIQDPDELIPLQEGWLGRLSAPGYMDCTDWSVYDSEKEALEELQDAQV